MSPQHRNIFVQGTILIIQIIFNPDRNKCTHGQWSVGQITSTVSMLGMDKSFHLTQCDRCNYLYVMGLKLFHVFHIFNIDSIQAPEKIVKSSKRSLINSRTSDKFIQNMSLENWNSVYNNENPQEAYSTFSNIIKKHYAMCFPKITVNGTYRNRLPWLTDALRQSIRQKNKLHKLSIKKPVLANKLTYRTYRYKLTHLLKRAEKIHYQQKF